MLTTTHSRTSHLGSGVPRVSATGALPARCSSPLQEKLVLVLPLLSSSRKRSNMRCWRSQSLTSPFPLFPGLNPRYVPSIRRYESRSRLAGIRACRTCPYLSALSRPEGTPTPLGRRSWRSHCWSLTHRGRAFRIVELAISNQQNGWLLNEISDHVGPLAPDDKMLVPLRLDLIGELRTPTTVQLEYRVFFKDASRGGNTRYDSGSLEL